MPEESQPNAETQVQDGATKPPEGEEQQPKTYDEDYVKQLRAEAAKYRTEAKAARSEVEQTKAASMSEAERAVAEAKAAGRTEAATEFGKRLARTEFDAIAGRRNPDVDTASVLEYVDLGRFVGEDGEPDTEAIKAAVERLVPASNGGFSSGAGLDLGVRGATAASGGDFNQVLRKAAGRA